MGEGSQSSAAALLTWTPRPYGLRGGEEAGRRRGDSETFSGLPLQLSPCASIRLLFAGRHRKLVGSSCWGGLCVMQSASRSSLVPRLIRLAVPLGLIALAAALLLSTRKLEAHNRQPPAPAIGPIVRYSPLAVLPSECSARIAAARVPVEHTLSRGETLGKVLLGLGFSGEEARQVTAVLAARVSLRRLEAGNRYSAFWNPDSTLAALDLTLAREG